MPAMETQGVQLLRGNGASPEVFSAVARIVNFDGPGGSASEIDATDLSSAAKEFLVGLRDEGTFSFEVNLDTSATSQAGLRSDRADRTLRNFKLRLTDDAPETELAFSAYVMEFRISGGVDQVIKANITLRISGEVVWSND